jgi:predicted regulator of Ras-like GTPase activity (Roadblock/LC7/MglB family)
MDAAQALADLTEISSQIQAAVLADADGSVVASTFREANRGKELAGAAVELVAAAEHARGESPDLELVQLQAVTPQGSVFVVRDARHVVAAITGAKPTVGLVFYDLKTCLRMLEREESAKAPKPAKAEKADKAEKAEKTPKAEEPKETTIGKASSRRRAASTEKEESDGGS